jgi:hypothetical protein
MLMFSSVSLVTSPFVPMCVRFGYPWRLSKTNFVRSNTYEKHGLVLFWASYHIMSLRPRVAYGSLKARGSSFFHIFPTNWHFFRHTTILCHIMPHCLICQRHGNRWNKPVQPLSSVGRLHVSHCYQLPSGVGASFLVGDMHMEPGMVRIIWKMRIFVCHVKLDKHVPKLGKWLETAWKVTGHQGILRIPGSFQQHFTSDMCQELEARTQTASCRIHHGRVLFDPVWYRMRPSLVR